MKHYDITVTEARTDSDGWVPDAPTEKVYSGADMNWMGAIMWLSGVAFGLAVGAMLL